MHKNKNIFSKQQHIHKFILEWWYLIKNVYFLFIVQGRGSQLLSISDPQILFIESNNALHELISKEKL